MEPITENQNEKSVKHKDSELKAKWINETRETLETLEPSQVGLIKTMVCSLRK